MIREPRYYLSYDCDIEENRLQIFQAPNGDFYLSILKPNERFSNTHCRITTDGARKQYKNVANAVLRLWESLPEKDIKGFEI